MPTVSVIAKASAPPINAIRSARGLLGRTDVRADECDERRTDAEDERDQQVLEPAARSVSRDGVRTAGDADERRRQRDGQRRLQRADGADAADA